MSKQLIMNNVVSKDTMREIQSRTLNELAEILKLSFGPNGSNACIKKENALSRYSKDGHTIIGSLHYNGIIEQSIKDDVESITRHIVKTVGDGTTSAVILSSYIFEAIKNLEADYQPAIIVRALKSLVNEISENIKEDAMDLTIDDVYDIAMISTNGDVFISNTLKGIYEQFGTSVFIDVSPSIGEELVIKSYDGMTLNTGYCDSCYVTDTKNNTAVVDHPEVYFFEHPVDTKELGVYLDSILSRNIIDPVNSQDYSRIVPTVIFAPTISQDMSSLMDSLTSAMAQMPTSNKLPVCIITAYHEIDQLTDLAKMCGAKLIRKYIDANVYKADVERGAAPTPETIFNWGGTCDRVVAYSDKTSFIRPSKMYNEDGSYSELYNNLLQFLEVEIKKGIEDGENGREIGKLKRRLHSLKSNMVELFVGGITQADRDALRDLVEDAVLNIRSAAANGVGLAANMSALNVIYNMKLMDETSITDPADVQLKHELLDAVWNAYCKLFKCLYKSVIDECNDSNNRVEFTLEGALREAANGIVYNIRTDSWEDNVKTSIMSDITILDTVSRIIGIMATCNQFILPSAMHNIYTEA